METSAERTPDERNPGCSYISISSLPLPPLRPKLRNSFCCFPGGHYRPSFRESPRALFPRSSPGPEYFIYFIKAKAFGIGFFIAHLPVSALHGDPGTLLTRLTSGVSFPGRKGDVGEGGRRIQNNLQLERCCRWWTETLLTKMTGRFSFFRREVKTKELGQKPVKG